MKYTRDLEACVPDELMREPTPEGVYFRVVSTNTRSSSGAPVIEVASDSELLLWQFIKDRWGEDEASAFIEDMRPPILRR